MIIPLHSLVVVISDDHKNSLSEAKRLFPEHEIMTVDKMSVDLVGQSERFDLSSICLAEIRRRMLLKLSLGSRVVIAGRHFLNFQNRKNFSMLTRNQGASVIFVVPTNYLPNENDLSISDKIIKIDDVTSIVQPLPPRVLPTLKSKFRGITVFGDVHGNLAAMKDALSWAKSRNHFSWFLGDIIDCGSDTLSTLEIAYRVIMDGQGAFILGNHERKVTHYLSHKENDDGKIMTLSQGNQVTIDALLSLTPIERNIWIGKLRALLSQASIITEIGDIVLAHAAIHPDFWKPNSESDSINEYALYGEQNKEFPDFTLSHKWIDYVPNGKTVFVGHDVRSTLAPLVVTGKKGGRVVFLDTGCGKGGPLSTADLRFDEKGNLNLENFNRY